MPEESPFSQFQQRQATPRQARGEAPALLVILGETTEYLLRRGNDPAMVATLIAIMGQLELLVQALVNNGIDVPLLIVPDNLRFKGDKDG